MKKKTIQKASTSGEQRLKVDRRYADRLLGLGDLSLALNMQLEMCGRRQRVIWEELRSGHKKIPKSGMFVSFDIETSEVVWTDNIERISQRFGVSLDGKKS